ncbi:Rap1a/Tai family immunity protein [Enterobacter hormaechei]|uniref:Rap1a/Tai family immunity protein n=1 Tax=Enterobacter hormaechei TaxID=158836 RepID=UPI001867249C|nr:Rap1a/Tai family immunity protein [Enterobacter hormaechei]
MKKIAIAIGVGALIISFDSMADYYGGNDIAKWSDSRLKAKAGTADNMDYVNVATLRGLVIGVHDAFEGSSICSPQGATNGQIVDTVTLYVSNHPEKRTDNASLLAYEALSNAYPCKK